MAITKLYVKHVSTGVYGRVLVHLHRRTADQAKLRVFSPGDIVGMYEAGQSDKTPSAEGIVYKVNEEEISIAFREMQEFE